MTRMHPHWPPCRMDGVQICSFFAAFAFHTQGGRAYVRVDERSGMRQSTGLKESWMCPPTEGRAA